MNEAMAVELKLRGVPFIRQAVIEVGYKNNKVGEGKVDFLMPGKLIVELKAVEELSPLHAAQLVSYLKMTGLKLGLLINFNVELLKQGVKRIINPRHAATAREDSNEVWV